MKRLRLLAAVVITLTVSSIDHPALRAFDVKKPLTMEAVFLMGKPAPSWLTDGVPRLQMEDHLRQRKQNGTETPSIKVTIEGVKQ